MPQVDVSCIVPVKNGEAFLQECLDSLLLQNFDLTFEVCIFDDGSTDSTPQIIEQNAPLFQSRNILFFSQRAEVSGGVGYAKNGAVQLSQGRFLCFCDADDISLPNRLRQQVHLCLQSHKLDSCIVGAQFSRLPVNATTRYTKWACSLAPNQLKTQVYTSFGPTLIAPTWLLSRALYNQLGGFDQTHRSGFPEDLDFFYRALRLNVDLIKLEEVAIIYRHHNNCSTNSVTEHTIWTMRMMEIQNNVLNSLTSFTIWNAGRQGKKFFRSLTPENQKKVVAMCDVDENKIRRKLFEVYDEQLRKVTARLPIISYRDCKPPVIICIKVDMTEGVFEQLLAQKLDWREQNGDFIHFN